MSYKKRGMKRRKRGGQEVRTAVEGEDELEEEKE